MYHQTRHTRESQDAVLRPGIDALILTGLAVTLVPFVISVLASYPSMGAGSIGLIGLPFLARHRSE